MPERDPYRDRERRHSREPESDREPGRRPRRASDGHRRRRGHRATDSTGELLPKNRDGTPAQFDSSNPSSPRKSRRSESASASSGKPLRSGSLAQLDALNQKKRGKGYDEAYLEEVRDKEQRMEKERRKAERQAVQEERAQERELEAARRRRALEEEELREADLDKRREEERARRREEKSRLKLLEKERQEQNRLAALRAERARSKPKKKEKPAEEYEYTDSEDDGDAIRLREERRSGQKKYSRIVKPDEKRRRRDHSERQAKRNKHRLVSGPYVEDGRAEKVYRHEKPGGMISKAMAYVTNPQKKKRLICKCNATFSCGLRSHLS
jgi:glucan 1,3-beta-glucosidase